MPSSEWVLVGTSSIKDYDKYSCCPEAFPYIKFIVHISRRPMFYVFNLILPCIMMTMVESAYDCKR